MKQYKPMKIEKDERIYKHMEISSEKNNDSEVLFSSSDLMTSPKTTKFPIPQNKYVSEQTPLTLKTKNY